MPRQASFSSGTLTDKALAQFWRYGYNASSMDDLVRATSVSRHGIYKSYGGKKQLFLACFERYQDTIVTPAFRVVEQDRATLEQVRDYFERQIKAGETSGLPGSGCFVANSASEVAPFDVETMKAVEQHNGRLFCGFRNAIENEKSTDRSLSGNEIDALAELMVVFTNGLWSRSRVVSAPETLRASVALFFDMIKGALS